MKDVFLRVFDRLMSRPRPVDELHVYDFDDTLVQTDSYVYVEKSNGSRLALTPHDYATHEKGGDDVYDYSDFEEVINPRPIKAMVDRMKASIVRLGPENVFVLTARGNPLPVEAYLSTLGLDVRVYAVGSGDPEAKARVIRDQIESRGYRRVEFFDDAPKYIASVEALNAEFPDVEIIAVQV